MKLAKIICLFITIALAAVSTGTAQSDHAVIRRQAQKAYQNGNWNDAYQLFRRLCVETVNDPKIIGRDFGQARQCLRNLNRINELDEFRETVIEKHIDNWRLLQAAAGSYSQDNHWGYMVAGKFHRGQHRGGGKTVNAFQRDRVRALQLMNRALALSARDSSKSEVANFYLEFARTLLQYSGHNQSWRLQYLTDLTRLPDYEPGHGYGYGSGTRGAPVDQNGNPVFYVIPDSFQSAGSDGERWRWLLANAARIHPDLETHIQYILATFLHSQFGVQTLSSYAEFFARSAPAPDKDGLKDELRPYAADTLSDNETLSRLAVGVKRFSLPDEFNYIRLFKQILQSPNKGYADDAARNLARIYENRRLYDRAVDYWRQYKQYDSTRAQRQIDQIIDSWGVFEPIGNQPSGRLPTVEYRFRNGSRVHFKAYRIRVATLLKDVKAYIRSNPRRLDRHKMEINNIGWRLVHENQTRYIGLKTADWDLELTPDKRHWDRRITVKVPESLSRPGAYLLVAKLQDGNTARIIIWVSNTTIIKKPLNKQVLYFLADAVNGQPLGNTTVDFFGYRTARIKGTKDYRILHENFSRQTDRNGQIIMGPAEIENNYQWLATVSTPDRLAYLGFSGIWYPNYHNREYNQTKTFVMTDRPVYRPTQKVHFKLWVRHARYDQTDTSAFGGHPFTVWVYNPQNEQIYTQNIQADAYGGLEGEFIIPADAPLGVYRISHGSGIVYCGNTFRVEEYKKPEF